ncbi:hypothetical protein QKU48_gp0380 [Fadolivirus algeromassiliense]|jgi:hypothetical protein|uniref:Uncharacterized protein n=1 Tax=Fadolivirus FV1/VV64 TaxID=3070911 RepID=A0A7D3R1J6_9VIRU|nr:hypothetical protein QKU48_gp0380 [Fadolivirus algeromassiliense]QKF93838.1 hypothetical protein Fadolivirus_1_380 [Fadolivirus FV1/VV64]
MNNILLFILIAIVIVLFLEFTKQKSSENFEDSKPAVFEESINDQNYSNKYIPEELSNDVPTIKTINACPLKENDVQTDYYIKRILGQNTQRCPKPTQTIKEFNKDFFKFRDYTYNNSSMTLDPVDKITNLYLDGDLGQAGRHSTMKIRDIFDQVTCGQNLYTKPCVRLPHFDNTMHDGYNYNQMTGMYNTRDTWNYNNEKEMNGGQVDKNLYGNDPEDLRQFPAFNTLFSKN